MSEYVGHSGSSDARGGGSTHKTNSDAEQRKQVSVDSDSFILHASFTVIYHSCRTVYIIH